MDIRLVFCTIDSLDKAKKIAHKIVEEKLAACVNILPKAVSIYSWKDNIAEDEEFVMLIKTKEGLIPELQSRIKALHPYEVPEFISVEVKEGLEDYIDWIYASTK